MSFFEIFRFCLAAFSKPPALQQPRGLRAAGPRAENFRIYINIYIYIYIYIYLFIFIYLSIYLFSSLALDAPPSLLFVNGAAVSRRLVGLIGVFTRTARGKVCCVSANRCCLFQRWNTTPEHFARGASEPRRRGSCKVSKCKVSN